MFWFSRKLNFKQKGSSVPRLLVSKTASTVTLNIASKALLTTKYAKVGFDEEKNIIIFKPQKEKGPNSFKIQYRKSSLFITSKSFYEWCREKKIDFIEGFIDIDNNILAFPLLPPLSEGVIAADDF